MAAHRAAQGGRRGVAGARVGGGGARRRGTLGPAKHRCNMITCSLSAYPSFTLNAVRPVIGYHLYHIEK